MLCRQRCLFFIALFHSWRLFISFHFQNNYLKNIFKRTMFRTNRFLDTTKLATENISVCFSATHGTGKKLMITSSFTKDVYIRPSILLIRHQRQIYTHLESDLFTSTLVFGNVVYLIGIFFSIRVFLHAHWRLTEQQRKGGAIFYFTLPLPPVYEHSDNHLQLCIWDDYYIIWIAPLVFNRLLLDEISHLIELPFDWLMLCWLLFY